MIIEFEDNGQDFLTWKLDQDGRVIDCSPFQQSAWVGKYVFQHKYLFKGAVLFFTDTPVTRINQPLTQLKHRILSITQ
ncbi:hypothetical protein [Pedobacter sp. NJ-S-72]